MTSVLLISAIKTFLESELLGDMLVPQIHLGFLPHKTQDKVINKEPELPFIIVRPLDGRDENLGNAVKVKLLFGTQSEDEEGFLDVLNLMERVRIALLEKRTLERSFRLEEPYEWTFFEEQPKPNWFGEAITTWTLPTVLQEVEGI